MNSIPGVPVAHACAVEAVDLYQNCMDLRRFGNFNINYCTVSVLYFNFLNRFSEVLTIKIIQLIAGIFHDEHKSR